MPFQLVADAEIGGAIIDIIRKAQREITVVSPYNRRWDEVADELEKAHRRGVQVTVYYRDGTTDPGLYWANIDSIPVFRLHAKIYANERDVLITSLNVGERAMRSNREVGLLIRDSGLWREISEYVESLSEDGENREEDEWYDDDEEEENHSGERRHNFNFTMLRIPVGAKLTFKENRRTTCTVEQQDPPLVAHRRKTWSLSGLTTELKGGGNYSGPLYWEYNGEVLDDRRRRLGA